MKPSPPRGTPDFFPEAHTGHSRRVAAIFSARARRKRATLSSRVEGLGIPVLAAGPADALPLILKRLARYRALRSGRPM